MDCYTDRGQSYRGTISTTKDGYTCQSWDSKIPHDHDYNSTAYPEDDLSSNYCRNPGGLRSTPWCYTSSLAVKWQACNISICQPPTKYTPAYPLGSKHQIIIISV